MFRLFLCFALWLACNPSVGESLVQNAAAPSGLPSGLSYERRAQEKHVIHVLSIDPKLFRFEIVKAHNAVFGRESVSSIARRKGAVAAINAGFFEIGRSEDGRPSGTLIIDKKIFGLAQGTRSLLLLNEAKMQITRAEIALTLQLGPSILPFSHVNRFVGTKDIVFYTSAWGSHSLTPFERKEIVLDAFGKVTKVAERGDNEIPKEGFVLSFPQSYQLPPLRVGQKIEILTKVHQKVGDATQELGMQSAVSGIPVLMRDGAIIADLEKTGKASFVLQPQARTAVGIRADGTVVMVVVEHVYTQPLREVTLAQVAAILQKRNYSKFRLAIMTLPQIRKIVEEHYSQNSTEIGLSLPQLAQMMKDLGCKDAINLDGGGSSTLFLNGQTLNQAIGDADEALGEKTYRPVSDALVVMKK